jgi:hypothetical protein
MANGNQKKGSPWKALVSTPWRVAGTGLVTAYFVGMVHPPFLTWFLNQVLAPVAMILIILYGIKVMFK